MLHNFTNLATNSSSDVYTYVRRRFIAFYTLVLRHLKCIVQKDTYTDINTKIKISCAF